MAGKNLEKIKQKYNNVNCADMVCGTARTPIYNIHHAAHCVIVRDACAEENTVLLQMEYYHLKV
jgi:hypothetical protein